MKHTIASNVRVYREKISLTQDRLAKAVGTSRQTVCALEKGDYVPSLKLALLIAKHFKQPVEELFSLKAKK